MYKQHSLSLCKRQPYIKAPATRRGSPAGSTAMPDIARLPSRLKSGLARQKKWLARMVAASGLARQKKWLARTMAAIELAIEVRRERRMLRGLDDRALKDLGL